MARTPILLLISCISSICFCAMAEDKGEGQDFIFLAESAYTEQKGCWQIGIGSEYHSHKNTIEGDERKKESLWIWTTELEYGLEDWLQFEVEIPFGSLDRKTIEDGETSRLRKAGIMDVESCLRIRLFKEDSEDFFSPTVSTSFSVTWPSGNWRRGLGTDTYGFGWGLSLSKTMGDWAYHIGAELELANDTREAGETGKSDATELEITGAIAFSVDEKLSIICELLAEFERERSTTHEEHGTELTINPGVVYELAKDFEGGISVPLGLNSQSYDWGIIAKIQYEW